jgi:hypothetical protein
VNAILVGRRPEEISNRSFEPLNVLEKRISLALFHAIFRKNQVFLRQESCLARRVSHEDASFLGRLDIGLVIAAYAVTHSYKAKVGVIENVPVLRGEFEQAIGEAIVVLLLLGGVVESRVTEIIFAVCNEKLFELKRDKGEIC